MTTSAVTGPIDLTRPGHSIRVGTLLGGGLVVLIVLSWLVAAGLGYQYGVYLLTAVGFGAAVVGLGLPRAGLLGIGILCTLDPLMGWLVFTGGLLRWNTFNYWLLLVTVLWVPLLLRRGGAPMRIAQILTLLLAFGLIFSPDRARGIQDLLGVFALFGLTVYLGRVRFSSDDWYWLGVVCGTAAALGGLLFFVRQGALPEINRNAWAYFPLTALFALCLALPCALDRGRGTALLSVLAGVCIVWAFLSGSRGAMLMAAVSGVYFVAAMPGLGRRTVLVAILALTLVGAASQFTDLQDRALERVRVLFDPGTKLADRTSHRSELVRGGWHIFRQSPLGVGTGGFTEAWRTLGPREGVAVASRYRRLQAHAGWVKIMAENGIPGVLMLAAFVVSFAASGMRRIRPVRLLGFLTTTVIGLSFISTEYQNKGLWFLAAATIVMMGSTSPLAGPPGASEARAR